ncbi:MAG: NAD(P)H-binding protein [Solirubrobacteraceae bacterium]
MKRVVVFGATGFIGRALLPELGGHEVVAVSRTPRDDDGNVRWAVADVADRQAVAAALDGADAAYYLVHSLGSRDFAARDLAGARTVREEAERAGLRQIVYLGGLGDDEGDLSEHLRSRRDTAEALQGGAVPVTTLRAAMVVGAGSAAFETILALVDRLPAMVMPRWVSTETQPIALTDIVRYLAGVLGRAEALGRAYDAGGPEVMTYREMIERIAALRGKHPLLVEVPVLTPRLSSYWLHLVTPVKAGVARPLVEGLRNATVAHDDSIRALVPFELTPFEVAAREALAAHRR